MQIDEFDIASVTLLPPPRLGDDRGYFVESFRVDIFAQHCGNFTFVQGNESLCANEFCSLEPDTVISYKVTDCYNAECDKGVTWDDPSIGVVWPHVADTATLSAKDRRHHCSATCPPISPGAHNPCG